MSDLLSALGSALLRRAPRRRRAKLWASVYCEVCDRRRAAGPEAADSRRGR